MKNKAIPDHFRDATKMIRTLSIPGMLLLVVLLSSSCAFMGWGNVSEVTGEPWKPPTVPGVVDPENPPDTLIVEYLGEGIQAFRPFHADGPWEIRWVSSWEAIRLYIKDLQGDFVEIFGNANAGAGYCPQGGDFYLEVSSAGSWYIQIVAVGESEPLVR